MGPLTVTATAPYWVAAPSRTGHIRTRRQKKKEEEKGLYSVACAAQYWNVIGSQGILEKAENDKQ